MVYSWAGREMHSLCISYGPSESLLAAPSSPELLFVAQGLLNTGFLPSGFKNDQPHAPAFTSFSSHKPLPRRLL